MASFNEFNKITTDYAEILNKLFKNFIQFVALQYKDKLINKEGAKTLIDNEKHNDLGLTLNKYKRPIWQNSELKQISKFSDGKFSLSTFFSQYKRAKTTKPNSSILSFIDNECEIGPMRIKTISSIALILHDLRNKIAHGDYVKNEAEAAVFWSNLAQLTMSYPTKLLIKDDQDKEKLNEFENFIKTDLLHSWISFYKTAEEVISEDEVKDEISSSESTADVMQAGITDLYMMQNAFNDDLMQKIDAIKQNTTHTPSIALDENGIPLPIELTDQELEALKQSQKYHDELNEKYADYNPEEDVADSKSILEVVENEELLTYQEAFSELRQLKEKINKEIFLKHSERVQNWESILQWNLITMILDHSYSKKDDFKNNNFFQAIYNNENYSRATEDTVKRQRKIMDLQLDLFWGDIKEIVDRTQKEV